MKNHLYFICPTDNLETILNSKGKKQNYYCSSLGNSVEFDKQVMNEIKGLISDKNITTITFILSDTNKILLNAISGVNKQPINGLRSYNNKIRKQKKLSYLLWEARDQRIPILSSLLNSKISELKTKLSSEIKIHGEIYSTNEKTFKSIHMDVLHREKYSLN